MSRRAHLLGRPRRAARPGNIIFFDSEARLSPAGERTTRHEFRLAVALYCRLDRKGRLTVRREALAKTPSELWSFVDGCCRARTRTYLVAHNLVYDLSVSAGFDNLRERGWTLSSFYSKHTTSIFRWRADRRTLLGLDSGNFFAGPLAGLAKLVGLEQLSVDFATASDDELAARCRRDCEILVALWQKWLGFLDEHGCGDFKPTVASTAFNVWRRRFMPRAVHLHADALALALERASYRGARAECFWLGRRDDGKFYLVDVNSMYGAEMRSAALPAGLYNTRTRPSLEFLEHKLATGCAVAQVALDVDRPVFPHRINGRICYPVGRFRTTLTTPELALALERGWIVEIDAMSYYRRAFLFKDYVDYFFALRARYAERGERPLEEICKLLVNALYGKFGQRGFEQRTIGHADPLEVQRLGVYDAETLEFHTLTYLAGQVFLETRAGEAPHSFAAIAAHVTAQARLLLWSLLERVPAGHCFYCDTDALIVDQAGLAALESELEPHAPGKLRIEHTSPWLEVHGVKDYKMADRVRHKGISIRALETPDGAFQVEQWPRLASLVASGDLSDYRTQTVEKHRRPVVFSGEPLASGWLTPFRLDELAVSAVAPRLPSRVEHLSDAWSFPPVL